MERPELRRIPLPPLHPLDEWLASIDYIEMRVGEWDAYLSWAYNKGKLLVEFNDKGEPVASYKRILVV